MLQLATLLLLAPLGSPTGALAQAPVAGDRPAPAEEVHEARPSAGHRDWLRERLRQRAGQESRGEEAPPGRGAGDRLERLKQRLDRNDDGRVGRLERALTRRRLERAREQLDRHRERLDGTGRDRREVRGPGAGREARGCSGGLVRGDERPGRGERRRGARRAGDERGQGCGSGCRGVERGSRAPAGPGLRGERREV